MPDRTETILQQEKKKKRRLTFSICTFLMQKERYHRDYPLKQSSFGIFGFLLSTFTGKMITNKTAPGRASAGAAVIGRHLVPAEQQHPIFYP